MPEGGWLDAAWDTWNQGGFVMPFLFGALLLMWFGIGYRALTLRRGSRKPLRALLAEARAGELVAAGIVDTAVLTALDTLTVAPRDKAGLRGHLDAALSGLRAELSSFSALVGGTASIAPLAGLLGTVTGMITTFDSLGSMSMTAVGGGGISGGISEALVSTQMGLIVAVPGILIGALQNQRARLLEDELDQLVEVLSAEEVA